MDFTSLSVFSGTGMLDEGVRAALGAVGCGLHCLGYVERDAYAAALLLARMEDEALDAAPVAMCGIEEVDVDRLRDRIDILTASPPCQPFSRAGRRADNEDHRAWGGESPPLVSLLHCTAAVRPALVFLENSPTWVTRGGFRRFGEGLSRLGYHFAYPVFLPAASVGAAHRRERVFILAYDTNNRLRGMQLHGHMVMGHSLRQGSQGAGHEAQATRDQQSGASSGVWPLFAPRPFDWSWETIVREQPHLQPAVEPGLHCVVDGDSMVVDEERADQIRLLGNAVVPLQAALGFTIATLEMRFDHVHTS